ncbi:hypothetical protein [Carnobacterium pleistocenium]|uniref:hypothetical protein n=1 Tax=Carnobacterium pleistocenium TaxID=181073 RepID=UPI001E2C235B|nr:hypothetical protein [Carnobacterium pleistocenium]
MKKENIRMRLSTESKVLLDNLKNDFKSNFGVDVSYSSLVSQAVRTQYSMMHEIDWKDIKIKKLEFSDSDMSNDWEYQTSFMLEEDVLKALTDMQLYFKDVFDAKRIHRAFCVRLCIKSFFLKNNLTKE